MNFYNRTDELALLHQMEKTTHRSSKMTVMVGRRRIGKTTLLREAYEHSRWVYWFVTRKSEPLLCEEFIATLEASLGIKVLGEFKDIVALFEYVMVYAQSNPFTLVIDEFQEFYHINPSIYSGLQNIWDRYKATARLNWVVSGSIYSLMKKIFEHSKEPLFGRADLKIHLKPFSIDVLQSIYCEQVKKTVPLDFLAFYVLTGGVAKYVEKFLDDHAFSFDRMLDLMLKNGSVFVNEGREILIEEFGRAYTTYFSILSLIASSKTSRSEIESVLQKDIGGYLEQLEVDYTLIKRVQPILAKPGARLIKYVIEDNFLNFWFRFIYKYQSAIEMENFDYVREIIEQDFSSYAGKMLEKLLIEKLKLSKQYSQIGSYWERGNINEIDIVAINERNKKVLIAEVKWNPKKLQLNVLKQKAARLIQSLEGYEIQYAGFSLEDVFAEKLI
jgi:AAA+ ATPase superfamily predicted ATPase